MRLKTGDYVEIIACREEAYCGNLCRFSTLCSLSDVVGRYGVIARVGQYFHLVRIDRSSELIVGTENLRKLSPLESLIAEAE